MQIRRAKVTASKMALIVMAAAMSLQPGHAQSDGTLEEAYAAQCAQHQDNRVCSTLRDAMKADAASERSTKIDTAITSAWGPLASLAGTTWQPSLGGVVQYRWLVPGQQLEVRSLNQNISVTTRIALGADGSLTTEAKTKAGVSFPLVATVLDSGAVRYEYPSGGARETERFLPGSSSTIVEKLVNNEWIQSGTYTSNRLLGEDLQRAVATTEAAYEAAPAYKPEGWAILPNLAGPNGSWWRGPNGVWLVRKIRFSRIGTWGKITPDGPEGYQVETYDESGGLRNPEYMVFSLDKEGQLRSKDYTSQLKLPAVPNGLFFKQFRHALVQTGRDSFEFRPGKFESGQFISEPKFSWPASGRYVRLNQTETVAFNALAAQRAEEKRLAVAQRKSQDNGLLGAIAMGAGAAIAGGNVEMVYGAALKGAEMTTTNEGLRSGLAGQGDAMIASGADRMARENAPQQSYGTPNPTADPTSAPASSAATRPAASGATTRTVRMVLVAGILPTEADQKGPNGYGRNPNCQSNIITATIRNDPQSNVPVEELFNQYRNSFVTKCQRLGTISTGPTYEIEPPYPSRFGETGWNDRLVTLP